MIYNENGMIIEFVTIDGNKFELLQSSILNESYDDSFLKQKIDYIQNEIKECDDKKLKKLNNNTKSAYLAKKIESISGTLKVLFGTGTFISSLWLTKESNTNKSIMIILSIIGALFTLCMAFLATQKISAKVYNKKINKSIQIIEEAISSFKMIADNDKLPKELRTQASLKMEKLISALNSFNSYTSKSNNKDLQQSIDKIYDIPVYATNKLTYDLKKDEYDKVIEIVKDKWKKIIKIVLDNINDIYNINIKTEKLLDIDGVEIQYTDDYYCARFYVEVEYEEFYIDDYRVEINVSQEDLQSKKAKVIISSEENEEEYDL